MERKSTPYLVYLLLVSILLFNCTGSKRKAHPGYGNLSSLADSITNTPMKSGRFGLASEFFEQLKYLEEKEGKDSANAVLISFFARLHPSVRITDSLAVLQMVEWMGNCFTQMDSSGVFYTNGDADTYAAWYLQQVEGARPDIIIISLPYLVAPDYRQMLRTNLRIRSALNLSENESIPAPPSTDSTKDVQLEMVTRQITKSKHSPIYLAPRCGIGSEFGGHIVDLGLIKTYQDTIQPQDQILDQLISKLTRNWKLTYASRGIPDDKSYAARFPSIQYLTLLIRFAPEYDHMKKYEDLDTLFTYLEPALRQNWRYHYLGYEYCHKSKEACQNYLDKLKQLASEHPEDEMLQETMHDLDSE
jgi:hypothetical protein